MKRCLLLNSVVLAMLWGAVPVSAQAVPKKLIEFGWDMMSPSTVSQYIEKVRSTPFDGVVISTGYSYTFYTKAQTEAGVDGDIARLKAVKWGRLTDNFLYMVAGANVDWFDDKAWAPDAYLLRNAGFCAKVAKGAGFVGLYFEPEFVYWNTPSGPWSYEKQPRAKDKTFAEMAVMARKRGAQYMQAIEKQFPGPTILMSQSMSTIENEYLAGVPADDPDKRDAALATGYYGLLPAFLSGMLEAASPATTFIDGNEPSYYYSTPLDYFKVYYTIHQTCQQLVPPELRAKYRAQFQCGHAVFADFILGTQQTHSTGTYLTPQERAKWLEHNVYWALTSSDHYVWFYDERPNWKNGANIALEVAPAIAAACQKVATGEPLGFNVDEMVARAEEAVAHAEKAPLHLSKATVPRLGPTDAPPKIGDGLSDPAWSKAAVLGPFVDYAVARRKELFGATEARMTYDDQCLYIAFNCRDPQMKSVASGKFQDVQYFTGGDCVEVVIAATPEKKRYYDIRINPDNGRWHSLTRAGVDVFGNNSSWAGDFRSAVQKGHDAWTVELAIKWASMNMQPPKPGDRIQGNLIRRTHAWPDGLCELSSWSESRTMRCPEANAFGAWTFE